MTDSDIPTIISKEQALTLGLKRYFTGIPCKNGHISERFSHRKNKPSGPCIKCCREQCNRDYGKNRERRCKEHFKFRRTNQASYMLTTAKCRAKKLGRGFSIKKEDIKITEFCPCCNRKLIITGAGSRNKSTPSLDRIDSNLGYIPGNVAVICMRCNYIKRDSTSSELRQIADWIDSMLKK